jgi:hypothetical protein
MCEDAAAVRWSKSAAMIVLLTTVVSLAFAIPSFATTFGDIEIAPRKEFGAPQTGHYFEQRFGIANRSARSRAVRITIDSRYPRGGTTRASRTVQIPPRSESVVVIPFLVVGYYTPIEATIAIDGREQADKVLLEQMSAWEESSNPNVLLSRSVRYERQPAMVDIQRPEIAPQEWSASWIQYSRFAAVAVTGADWAQFPPAVQNAIYRWTFAGGTLMFVDRPDPMPVVSARSTDGRYGVGRILVFDDGVFEEGRIAKILQWRGNDASLFNLAAGHLPLLENDSLPLRVLYLALILFAIAAGPLSLFLLAKKDRRMWIFGTLPLFAIATSVLLVAATFASEGWVRIQRSHAITYLDETLSQAVTIGITGFYSTVSPRGEIRFAADTELRANTDYRSPINGDTAWDDGQRLFGGWVGTRVPTYFATRRSEPRRERLPLHFGAAGPSAVNGLGARIERVWVADANGEVFEAQGIDPGRAFPLVRSTKHPKIDLLAEKPIQRMLHAEMWMNALSNAPDDPTFILQPGTYVAILRDSPFIEAAMDRPTTMDRRGIVFGVSRLEGGAGAR